MPVRADRPWGKRVGKSLRQRSRRLVRFFLGRPVSVDVSAISDTQRILLIRPNFRIGNAAISTVVIACFRRRFPRARIDFLATNRVQSVLAGQPLDHVETLARGDLARPWRWLACVLRLRRRRYDLAVQINPGSFSGYLMARLAGARYTVGRGGGGQPWYGIEVPHRRGHAYDCAVGFAELLGVTGPDRPVLYTTPQEREEGFARLRECFRGDLSGFCAVFVGGHRGKRLSGDEWLAIINRLELAGRPHAVFLGPEEASLGDRFHSVVEGCRHGVLVTPQSLRVFCAMLAYARCLITPDSGPMHLAAGLGVPTITLIRDEKSLKFAPRGASDRVVADPTPERVCASAEALLCACSYDRTPARAAAGAGQCSLATGAWSTL